MFLRQSTAGQEVSLGYFVGATDANTEMTSLTIANTDIKIWKEGATALVSKNSGGATHMSNGIYYIVLDATDTSVLGSLDIFCHMSGALAIKLHCVVLVANVYDSIIANTAKLFVDSLSTTGVNAIRDSILTDATRFAGANINASISSRLAPTVPGNTLDVNVTGEAGIDWGNIGNKSTTVNLSGTQIFAVNLVDTTQHLSDPVTADIQTLMGSSAACLNFTQFFTAGVGYNAALSKIGTCTAVSNPVTAGTVTDKTGFALSTAGANAVRDTILTDATRFPGAYIDKQLSTISGGSGGSTDLTPVLNRLPVALVGGKMDSIISAAPDSAGTVTLLNRLTDPRATNLDHLNADITSRGTSNYAGTPTGIDWSQVINPLASVNLSNTQIGSVAQAGSTTTVGSVLNPVTVGTNNDKDNYRLSAVGVSDILHGKPSTELGGMPATIPDLLQMLQFLFEYFSNRRSVSKVAGTETLYKNDGASVLGTSTISDDGNTFTKERMS